MKNISSKQSVRLRELRQLKKEMLLDSRKCALCGKERELDLCHIIRRSYSTMHYTNPNNLFLACRKCHDAFDNGTWEERNLLNIDPILNKMKELDELYYIRYVYDRQTDI